VVDTFDEKGSKKFITENDLPALLPRDESKKLGQDLQSSLEKQRVSYWTMVSSV
jgi:hypothetical protein